MNIPQQFSKKFNKTLLIVTGKQDAIIYSCKEDTIEELKKIIIPNPQYADGGQYRLGADGGGAMRAGSVTEVHNEQVIGPLLHELATYLKNLHSMDYDAVILFCPAYIKNRLQQSLPYDYRRKMSHLIEGNFFFEHPVELLKKIDIQNQPVNVPTSREARKILMIPHQERV